MLCKILGKTFVQALSITSHIATSTNCCVSESDWLKAISQFVVLDDIVIDILKNIEQISTLILQLYKVIIILYINIERNIYIVCTTIIKDMYYMITCNAQTLKNPHCFENYFTYF